MSQIKNIENRRSKGYAFIGRNMCVVDSLFIVAPVVCGGYMFVLFFVQCVLSYYILLSCPSGRDGWLLNFMCPQVVMSLLLVP